MSDSRILVVDDEERTRTYICDGLSALGITDQARGVATAEEALAEADREPIDLVISDVRMPGLNGLDLARYLHQSHPTTRVILITGYSTRDIERTAVALSVEALLKKPFALDQLGEAVRNALRLKRPSQPAIIPTASEESIPRQIKLIQRDTGAQWIGLMNASGKVIMDTGANDELSTLLTQIEYQGWSPMIASISDQTGPCFLYVEGQPYDVYITSLDRSHCLIMIYDRRWQTSRIGAVWLSARHAMQTLTGLLSIPPSPPRLAQPVIPDYAQHSPMIEP